LHPLFAATEEPGVRDNAVGAVARMMMAAAAQLPLESILPVFLQALPLREDLHEAVPAYQALCHLVLGDQAGRMSSVLQSVMAAFGGVVLQEGVEERVKVDVGKCVAELHQRYAQQVDPLIAALPQEQQAALLEYSKK
jgi:importin-4